MLAAGVKFIYAGGGDEEWYRKDQIIGFYEEFDKDRRDMDHEPEASFRTRLADLRADSSGDVQGLDPETKRQTARYAERLNWAPAVANGTAIVALAGVVGSVPSPDTALSALTWPLAVFSIGAAASLLSITLAQWALGMVSPIADDLNRSRTARLASLDEAENLISGLTPENAAARADALDGLVASMKARHEKSMVGLNLKRARRYDTLATALNAIAVGTVAVGLAILLVGHSIGAIRLEKQTPVSGPSSLSPAKPSHHIRQSAAPRIS